MLAPDQFELELFEELSRAPRRRFWWRYGPVVLWIGFTFLMSTENFSSDRTGAVIQPVLKWLFPGMSDATFETVHHYIRKSAHLFEYAVLAGLLARALLQSWTPWVRRHWFLLSLGTIIVAALADEFHQSFVPGRTATPVDSMIDTAGALIVLIPLAIVHYIVDRHMRDIHGDRATRILNHETA